MILYAHNYSVFKDVRLLCSLKGFYQASSLILDYTSERPLLNNHGYFRCWLAIFGRSRRIDNTSLAVFAIAYIRMVIPRFLERITHQNTRLGKKKIITSLAKFDIL